MAYVTLKGVVKNVREINPSFSIVKVEPSNRKDLDVSTKRGYVTLVGEFPPIAKEEEIEVDVLKEENKYGEQFKVKGPVMVSPLRNLRILKCSRITYVKTTLMVSMK